MNRSALLVPSLVFSALACGGGDDGASDPGGAQCPTRTFEADADRCLAGIARLPRTSERLLPCQLADSSLTQLTSYVDEATGMPVISAGEGWYLDDFSAEAAALGCQRIAFTGEAPSSAVLECQTEIPQAELVHPDLETNLEQPTIGDRCDQLELRNQYVTGDQACVLILRGGHTDESMFCHGELNVCALRCESAMDCPDGWSCGDDPSAGIDEDFCHIAACR